VEEQSFIKMMKERLKDGRSTAIVSMIKKDGEILPCEITSALFFNLDGMEMAITTITDRRQSLRRQKNIDTQKELVVAENIELALKKSHVRIANNREWLQSVAKTSYDVMWDWDIKTNTVWLGDSIKEVFGLEFSDQVVTVSEISAYLFPEERQIVLERLKKAMINRRKSWKDTFLLRRPDGTFARTTSRARIIRDKKGRALRLIGATQDVSKLKILEGKLENELILKERQISDASEEAREIVKSDIGKELHDNVNQLLGASQQYLDLATKVGDENEMLLRRSSEYTQTAIEAIRKLTHGLNTDIITELGLRDAIDNIIRDTMEINPVKIICIVKGFRENKINNKFKVNLFRIIQEQLNNIIKHARATNVNINLVQSKESIILGISDNGIGFDTIKKQEGIGMANIKSRAGSFNGSAEFLSKPEDGCILNLTFPLSSLLLN
jgi:PAS domain S-box-containing protein